MKNGGNSVNKCNKIAVFVLGILLSFCLSGCVAKSDIYGGGDEPGPDPGTQTVSIRYLKTVYTGYPTRIDKEFDLHGIVTANDRFGAYRYTLVVQDETGGIEVKVGGELLYTDFPVGQEIVVRCQSLVLGNYGGVVSLGTTSGDPKYENDFIPESNLALFLRKTDKIEDVRPCLSAIPELTTGLVGCFVAFENVQFVDEELNRPWSDPDVDTDRHLVNETGDTLLVRTRSKSDFASRLLPSGSGYVEGILGYFNRKYQLRVVNPKNVILESPRFTPHK